MYSYTYDKDTGGLLLNFTKNDFSKEPRPVYAQELDVLGFDKYWKYDKQTEFPYMWAEANLYYYKGTLVAKLKGGDVFTAPEIVIPNDENGVPVTPEPNGEPLRPVDIKAMVSANSEIMEILEQTTIKKILGIYSKYKDKLDCFHVAFSGGKDSCVLLDLVKKALPRGSFIVVFGDTGMEFPDTYDLVEKTKAQCLEVGIPFYVAKSHFTPEESWKLFGPPSRTLRWCCSVHKSTPQTLKLREITGKNNYIGLDFVGVRAQESIARSQYKYENYSVKQKGQYSHNSILEWTSAEVWLHIYKNCIEINKAYKKGNSRAGCLFCPMSNGCSSYVRRESYPKEVESFLKMIIDSNEWDKNSATALRSYLINGGWEARKSGRGISGNILRYKESSENGTVSFKLTSPFSDWKEWIKTLSNKDIPYTYEKTHDGWSIHIQESYMKNNPNIAKLFRIAIKKSAYCVGCRVCESNCKSSRLHFINGKLSIKDCLHCYECYDIPSGCHAYNSLKISQEEKKMKSINCFDDHAPKREWIESFFSAPNDFLAENTLGPNQKTHFKRFLRDSNLIQRDKPTTLTKIVQNIGWESSTSWAIILINLVCENAQISWYTTTFDINYNYKRSWVEETLIAKETPLKAAKSIAKAFKRLVETPLGTSLNWGFVTDEGDLVRTKCTISDPRVILYGLFKFAEKCNDYKEFTLATLLNDSIERDGVSPSRIFGLNRDDMIPILLGLSAKYPDFISASFTHDLEKITLANDKSSQDVLNLFEGDL